MSAENFVGGTNWVITYPNGGWGFKHLDDGADPAVEMAGLDYQQVDRPPGDFETWDGSAWATDLEPLRANRWAAAKAVRDAIVVAGCATPKGRVDTDEASCQKINGAVTAAIAEQLAGQPFSIDWTMEDNSVVTHSGAELITMGMSVVAFMNACQAAGTAIRDAIEAASDAAAIAAIDIEAGYPGG